MEKKLQYKNQNVQFHQHCDCSKWEGIWGGKKEIDDFFHMGGTG